LPATPHRSAARLVISTVRLVSFQKNRVIYYQKADHHNKVD
jgi:hypothetical protein